MGVASPTVCLPGSCKSALSGTLHRNRPIRRSVNITGHRLAIWHVAGEEQNATPIRILRHAARNGLSVTSFAAAPAPTTNPDGNHGIQVGRRGAACSSQRHWPQHQQERSAPPEHAMSISEKRFTVTPQYAAGVKEAAGHNLQSARIVPDALRASLGINRLAITAPPYIRATDAKRGEHVPVCQHAARHRPQENSRKWWRDHQAVDLHQLIAGGELTQNAVLRRGVSCRANAYQRVANKRLISKQMLAAPRSLRLLANIMTRPFGEAVRHSDNKRRKSMWAPTNNSSVDRLAPVGIKPSFQQRQSR